MHGEKTRSEVWILWKRHFSSWPMYSKYGDQDEALVMFHEASDKSSEVLGYSASIIFQVNDKRYTLCIQHHTPASLFSKPSRKAPA